MASCRICDCIIRTLLFLAKSNIQQLNTEQLYAQYFEPYRNVVQPIVRGENKTDTKSKAFQAYETKNYEDALKYFNTLMRTKSRW